MNRHPEDSELRLWRENRLGEARLEAVDRHLDGCRVCKATIVCLDESVEASLLERIAPAAFERVVAGIRSRPLEEIPWSIQLARHLPKFGRSVGELLDALAERWADQVASAVGALRAPEFALVMRSAKSREQMPAADPRTALFTSLARVLRKDRSTAARLVAAALALEAGDANAAANAVELLPKSGEDALRLRAWHSALAEDDRALTRHLAALDKVAPKSAAKIRAGLKRGLPSAKLFLGQPVESYVVVVSRQTRASP